jgi:twitching motility protein PilT
MIDLINQQQDHCHLITIEDPIEFYHPHKVAVTTQREVHVDVPSFAEALRRALRQDPEVILVGELRDLETIEMAVSAAETGQKLPFFTVGESADVEKLVEHDATILEEIDKIRDALTELELSVMEDIADSRKGLNMIRIGVSNARNRFGERISFIKGIK